MSNDSSSSILTKFSHSKLCAPRLCALCGDNPSTLSQAMHNAGFTKLGLPFVYVAFNTVDTEFAISAMRRLGIRGYSLTIPHKQKSLNLLDSLSCEAQAIGAVNTVINTGEALLGYNTDISGIERSFLEQGVSSLSGKRVLVLGAGGAASSAIYFAMRSGCAELLMWTRTSNRKESLLKKWPNLLFTSENLSCSNINKVDIIINATPLGSFPMSSDAKDSIYPFSLAWINEGHIVFDMVTRETPLITMAFNKGAVAISGLRMLLFQAVEQFALFTDIQPPFALMEEALYSEIEARNKS